MLRTVLYLLKETVEIVVCVNRWFYCWIISILGLEVTDCMTLHRCLWKNHATTDVCHRGHSVRLIFLWLRRHRKPSRDCLSSHVFTLPCIPVCFSGLPRCYIQANFNLLLLYEVAIGVISSKRHVRFVSKGSPRKRVSNEMQRTDDTEPSVDQSTTPDRDPEAVESMDVGCPEQGKCEVVKSSDAWAWSISPRNLSNSCVVI